VDKAWAKENARWVFLEAVQYANIRFHRGTIHIVIAAQERALTGPTTGTAGTQRTQQPAMLSIAPVSGDSFLVRVQDN
jgi:hypothetical protein